MSTSSLASRTTTPSIVHHVPADFALDLVHPPVARDTVHDGVAPLVIGDQGLGLSAVYIQPILNRVGVIISTVEERRPVIVTNALPLRRCEDRIVDRPTR